MWPRRYNQVIGLATQPIRAGQHVHVQNVMMASVENDYAVGTDAAPTEYVTPPPDRTLGRNVAGGELVARRHGLAHVQTFGLDARTRIKGFKGDNDVVVGMQPDRLSFHHHVSCGLV